MTTIDRPRTCGLTEHLTFAALLIPTFVVIAADADALGARPCEHVRARGSELQSGADVVYETGDLAVALPSARALREHIGEVGKAIHAHAAIVPPAAR